ncbi:6824_t:CDS:1, partial [Ambispora leptoticha]
SQSGSYEPRTIPNLNAFISPESTLNEFSKMHITHTPQQESYSNGLPSMKIPPSQRTMSDTATSFLLGNSKNQHKRSHSLSEEEDKVEICAFMSSQNYHPVHDSKSRVIAASSRLGQNRIDFLQQLTIKNLNENFNQKLHSNLNRNAKLNGNISINGNFNGNGNGNFNGNDNGNPNESFNSNLNRNAKLNENNQRVNGNCNGNLNGNDNGNFNGNDNGNPNESFN